MERLTNGVDGVRVRLRVAGVSSEEREDAYITKRYPRELVFYVTDQRRSSWDAMRTIARVGYIFILIL